MLEHINQSLNESENLLPMKNFLRQNNFVIPDKCLLTKKIFEDMEAGLICKMKSDQPMLLSFNNFDSKKMIKSSASDEKIIIIDAGGTNFRSSLAHFTEGKLVIDETRKTFMPATDRNLSKKEFYSQIAANIDYLKNKSTKIAFCFSYAMKIGKNNDGKILALGKEVNAPEAVNSWVGKELKKSLKKNGWDKIKKIILLNDTTASLIAGTSQKDYSSYIGFILGTGMNSAYIETKNSKEKIIVTECGMFSKIDRSTFDIIVDDESKNIGASLLEKMCSGAYLGNIVFHILKVACNKKIFSLEFEKEFSGVQKITWPEVSIFLDDKADSTNTFERLLRASSPLDIEFLYFILNSILNRTASIVASIIAANILKCKKGKSESEKICVVCNGSTFWKTPGLASKIKTELGDILKGDIKRYYSLVKIDDDISTGTTLAAS